MDNQYINLIDSCHAAATLATMIAVNANNDARKNQISQRYLEDLQKEIMRTRTALQEVLKMQEYEIHDDYRYPRIAGNLSER